MEIMNSNATPPVAPAAPAPAPTENILADLDVLITAGQIERVVEPLKGEVFGNMKIKMHTLSDPERKLVAAEIPNESLLSAAAVDHAPKVPTLIHAITEIEMKGKKYQFVTPEQKKMLRALLAHPNMGAVIIDELYLAYLEMINDLMKIIETGVKKN